MDVESPIGTSETNLIDALLTEKCTVTACD